VAAEAHEGKRALGSKNKEYGRRNGQETYWRIGFPDIETMPWISSVLMGWLIASGADEPRMGNERG